ncbi:MAG: four helix bundle protein [Candidatus Dadabacteria bacterium]|nr:four helix bundle protein [Candidatus Dadabacteria bacterium]NIQ16400.1 four helix bundle protein [Candidatus Dadabacteria bacterium]
MNLEISKLSKALAIDVHQLIAKFPKNEIYFLASPTRRAAVSGLSNIVEKKVRDSDVEFKRYLTNF